MERPLSQPYGCQLPFQGEPLENGKLWECRVQRAERRIFGRIIRPIFCLQGTAFFSKPSLKGKVAQRKL